MEWSKSEAIMEMAVFAKDRIEVRNLYRDNPAITVPAKPTNEMEITRETEGQKKNGNISNQEKNGGWKNDVIKVIEKGVLSNSFTWEEADANVRNCIFLCLCAEVQRQLQQKRPGVEPQ